MLSNNTSVALLNKSVGCLFVCRCCSSVVCLFGVLTAGWFAGGLVVLSSVGCSRLPAVGYRLRVVSCWLSWSLRCLPVGGGCSVRAFFG